MGVRRLLAACSFDWLVRIHAACIIGRVPDWGACLPLESSMNELSARRKVVKFVKLYRGTKSNCHHQPSHSLGHQESFMVSKRHEA